MNAGSGPVRDRRLGRAGRRRGAVAAVLLLLALVAVPAPPARATGAGLTAPRLPAEDDDALEEPAEACRHDADVFYVPRDPRGHWFWWYCRDDKGLSGDGFGPLGFGELDQNVNLDQPDNWEDWAKEHTTLGDLVDFTELHEEPCTTWDRAKAGNPAWDLEQQQCAKIKSLGPRQSPCDQWWDLIRSVQGQPNVEPLDTARDGRLIAKCRADQAIFQKAWAPPKIVDDGQYDRYDFSAPDELTGPIGDIVYIGQWVALVAGVFGVLVTAAKLAYAYHNGLTETVTGVVLVMASVSAALSATALASLFLIG